MTDATASQSPAPAVAIVLVEPQLAENIGTAARAMANFGLIDLRLIAPRDGWPSERARATSSGADRVIDAARVFPTVEQAIADLRFVLATTARPRDMVKPIYTPESAASELLARNAAGEVCGVMFGPERSGLENEHIVLADGIVMAPVDPRFASLNLAQAVLLIGYELFQQSGHTSLGRITALDGPGEEGLSLGRKRAATREQLLGFFTHLERELDACGFLRPPEKRRIMVQSIRNMFHRIGVSEQDVNTLRGIVTALVKPRGQGS